MTPPPQANCAGKLVSRTSFPAQFGWLAAVVVLGLVLLAGCASGDDEATTAAPAGDSGDSTTSTTAPTTTTSTPTTTSTVPTTTSTTAPPDERTWPGATWETVTPADAGLDPVALDEMAAAAERGGSQCLVVTHEGAVVGEWYWEGFTADTEREVFSVTKSITSTLVGIAQDRGLLDIDEPASTYIEEWRGTPSEGITIRNLLSNDSGRFQDFATDYLAMAVQAEDKTAFSIALDQQFPPGTEWVYNNAAIQTLEAVLEVATGVAVDDFARETLFEPLGMSSSIISDAAGNTLTFMGAQASCLDLARFGLLFLRDGEWDGDQVVSAEWVAEATSPSQELNPGYGYLWWLDDDGYAALGLHNQLLGVLPDDEVVAARLGGERGTDGSSFGLGELAAGVQQALGETPGQG